MWTLAHKAFYLAWIRDEAAAECHGTHRVAVVAERLGVATLRAIDDFGIIVA